MRPYGLLCLIHSLYRQKDLYHCHNMEPRTLKNQLTSHIRESELDLPLKSIKRRKGSREYIEIATVQ